MKKLLVSLIVLMSAAAPASAQNMVVDGGFEGLAAGSGWTAIAGETFGAWTGHPDPSYGSIWLYNGVDQDPAEGTIQCHIGDNYTAAHISQAISGFVIGQTNEVSLAATAYGDPCHPGGTLQVYNAVADACDLDDTFNAPCCFGSEMGYSSFEFIASNTELELKIFNPVGYATQVDDVSIVKLCDVVGTVVLLDDPMEVDEDDVNGSAVGFSAVLDNAPGATDTITVVIDPNSNGNGLDITLDKGAGPVAGKISLTFTTANWDTPQTVTVKAIDDTFADGRIEIDEIGFTATSAENDPSYDDGCLNPVEVTILDNDSPHVAVSKTSASVAEGGAGDT